MTRGRPVRLHELSIQLPDDFEWAQLEDVVRTTYLLDQSIREVVIAASGKSELLVRYEGDDVEGTRAKVRILRDEIAESHRRVPERILHRRARVPALALSSYDALRDAGLMLTASGALSGPALFTQLVRRIDTLLRVEAYGLGAAEYSFPITLGFETARACGLPQRFPHHVGYLALPAVDETVSAPREIGGDDESGVVSHLEATLSPATCYHFWDRFSATDRLKPTIGTAAAPCFRAEHPMRLGFDRLREFRMREIFAIDVTDNIATLLDRFLDLLVRVMERLDLDGRIATASDPFFVDVYSKQRMLQANLGLKKELQATFPCDSGRLAVGSVNDHRTFFTSRFGHFEKSSPKLASACAAFGLERLALAVLTQHGLDPAGWPDALDHKPPDGENGPQPQEGDHR